MGNEPIFVCTPAIERCQPGVASPNTCEAADPNLMCGGTTPICCKEITGLGDSPFKCVDDAANCQCLRDDDECMMGAMDRCCAGKCFESEPAIEILTL